MSRGLSGGSGKSARKASRGFRWLFMQYWRSAYGSRHLFVVAIASLIVDGLMQAGLVNYLKILIDQLTADPAGFVRKTLPGLAVLGIAAGVVFFPIAYAGHVCGGILASRLVTSFRMRLYRHLQLLSLSFYQKTPAGEITSRLTQDVDNGVHTFVGALAMNGLWAVAMLVTALASMLVMSWKLTVVFVLLNCIYMLCWRAYRTRIHANAREVRDQAGEINAFATEDVSSVVVMKAFAREDRFFNRFEAAQERLYRAQVRATKANHAFTDILQVLGKFLAPVVILGSGSVLVANEGMSVGSLVAFWSYWTLAQVPLGIVFGAGPMLATCMASVGRIADFLEQDPTPKDKTGAVRFTPHEGKISFESVTFTYPSEGGRRVFDDFCLTIPAHSSLGVVGPSGAGKSTLVQLALRFYDPDLGSVRIDGMDLRDMTQGSLRRSTGVVLQDSLLLSGTIRDNIVLGFESATDEQVWHALEMADAADFVKSADGGLYAPIGEKGLSLSGGQRQRLCIARVFLKNPPIVIFDEATSALDSGTELQIHNSMQKLLRGRTSIIIAHRLSTVKSCDSILMLKDGHICGMAPHAELLKSCQEYAELVNRQTLL